MSNKDHLWVRLMDLCKKYCGCHQLPYRSFFFKGYQFPLCARCTGITLGHISAFVLAPFHIFGIRITLLMIPLALDGGIQYISQYESNNIKRVITGFLYGFAFTSLFIRIVRSFIVFFVSK